MPSPVVPLEKDDVLELSATLAGLARVRHRFLTMASSRGAPVRAGTVDADSLAAAHMTALARAGLYNFLAATFAEPPPEDLVLRLRESGGLESLLARGIGGEALRRWPQDVEEAEVRGALASSYAELFVRSGPDAVSLLESDYRPQVIESRVAPGSMSQGVLAGSVVGAYQAVGLVVGGEGPRHPLHIAVEFQFLHHCAACEAAAWADDDVGSAETYRAHQAAFVRDHLLPWVGTFAERLVKVDAHPYYRAVAELGARFLAREAEDLASAQLLPGTVRAEAS